MADPKTPRMVPVYTPGLGVRMVTTAEAPEALKLGSRMATEAEFRQAKLDARYGGVGGAAQAAAFGFIRGAGGMFAIPTDAIMLSGASTDPTRYKTDDPFRGPITETEGDRWREKLGALQDQHPIASFVGEGAGIASTALVGSGIAGGAGAATESVLGRTALARVAGQAAEAGVYSAAKEANELAIRNEDLTAQKVIAAMGHGAVLGGGLGAAFEAGGGAIRKIASDLRGPSRDIATDIEAAGATSSGSLSDRMGEFFQQQADVKTIKALGGSAGDLRALERNVAGGYRRVAQAVRSDVEEVTGKSIGRHTRESLHEYATARVEELGSELGSMVKKLDTSGVGVTPDVGRFVDTVRKEILAPRQIAKGFADADAGALGLGGSIANDAKLIAAPGQKEVVKAVEDFLKEVQEAAKGKPPSFTDWHQWRIALDKQIKYEAAKVSPSQSALMELRGVMEKEFESSAEAAAQQLGTSFADKYQTTKALFQSVKKAEELTERGVSRDLVNNSLGLRATMAGLAGFASADPLSGMAMGIAGKIVQDRGDVLAADLLSRAAGVFGVRQLVNRTEAQMERGVAKLVDVPAPEGIMSAPAHRIPMAPLGVAAEYALRPRERFEQTRDALAEAMANPARTTAILSKSVEHLSEAHPRTAMAIVSTTTKGLTFLHSKLPSSGRDPFSLTPHLDKRIRVSDAAVSKFNRYAAAVHDPMMILDEAKKGTLTSEHVEAVATVYPDLYQDLRQQVFRSLLNAKREPTYQTRIHLGRLLGLPTDRTLAPDFLQAVQAAFSDGQAGAESPSPRASRPIKISNDYKTATEKAAAA